MSEGLIDQYGRKLNYARIAITDRCNLRCFYCMPDCGIDFVQRSDLLSYEEMERIIAILAGHGVGKIRVTGGEPLLRKGSIEFMDRIRKIKGVQNLHLTTNATLTHRHLDELLALELSSVNISLDTLNEARFLGITKRDGLDNVLKSIDNFLTHGIRLKINMVVMPGINDMDILPMAEMAKEKAVEVRFIEEMPFNGKSHEHKMVWDYKRLKDLLIENYPELKPEAMEHGSTAKLYKGKDWKGDLGIIAAFSRTFCGSCNRLRITPVGMLKTCLYDDGVLDLRALLRDGSSDTKIAEAVKLAVTSKPKNGFEAEANRSAASPSESMATIGG